MLKPSYCVFSKSGDIVWVNNAGTHSPISENKSILEVTLTTSRLNFCVLCFNPPINILRPRTNNTLPMRDPVIENFTTSNKPAFNAKNDIVFDGNDSIKQIALSYEFIYDESNKYRF